MFWCPFFRFLFCAVAAWICGMPGRDLKIRAKNVCASRRMMLVVGSIPMQCLQYSAGATKDAHVQMIRMRISPAHAAFRANHTALTTRTQLCSALTASLLRDSGISRGSPCTSIIQLSRATITAYDPCVDPVLLFCTHELRSFFL